MKRKRTISEKKFICLELKTSYKLELVIIQFFERKGCYCFVEENGVGYCIPRSLVQKYYIKDVEEEKK